MPYKNKLKELEYRKKRYESNKEEIKKQRQEYRRANPEKVKEQRQKSYKRHKDKYDAATRKYRETHKERLKILSIEYSRRPERILHVKNYIAMPEVMVKRKDWKLKDRYGITYIQYCDMLEKQEYLCAICKMPEIEKMKSGENRLLAVDHNHETGRVRGLLCRKCNQGIGSLKEDIIILNNAIEYLMLDC